jgi:hypothetical protein
MGRSRSSLRGSLPDGVVRNCRLGQPTGSGLTTSQISHMGRRVGWRESRQGPRVLKLSSATQCDSSFRYFPDAERMERLYCLGYRYLPPDATL